MPSPQSDFPDSLKAICTIGLVKSESQGFNLTIFKVHESIRI